jgi:hypothetical protein
VVNLVTNLVISHGWGKDREVFTTCGTCPWLFVTLKFHSGQPSHGKGIILPLPRITHARRQEHLSCKIVKTSEALSLWRETLRTTSLKRGNPVTKCAIFLMTYSQEKKYKQLSTKHTYKTKDRVTRTPLRTGGELKCSEKVSNSCSTSDTRHVNLVYFFQLIRYSRACGSYQDFLDRLLLLTRKLVNQGFFLVKLKSSLRKCYGRHHDLVDRYGISVNWWPTIVDWS